MRTRAMQYFDMYNVRFKAVDRDALPPNAPPVGKTAFVALDGYLAMTLIPSGSELDLEALRAITTAKFIRQADIVDAKMRLNVPEDEEVPPIDLYGAAVYIDERLCGYDDIVMTSGDPRRLLVVNYHDYARKVHPMVAKIATVAAAAAAPRLAVVRSIAV